MANRMIHRVAKGVQNRNNSNIMSWWKTNFNMPVPDVSDNIVWVQDYGPCTYYNEATSFDLTGFFPGWEVVAYFTIWHWDGPCSGTANLTSSWRDTDGSLMFVCANGINYDIDLGSGDWTEYWGGCNTGVAGWEIDVAGNYKVRSEATGAGGVAIAQKETTIAFSNVPSTTQLGSDKPGYIWVEGNNLCFICANRWKHIIIGDQISYVDTAKAGYMWIDTNNTLKWIGANGYKYGVKWRIKQFASTWSNGASGEVFAGTAKKGMIWVDNEFGWTHLSYIGNDGYKYLVGSGNSPYTAPY